MQRNKLSRRRNIRRSAFIAVMAGLSFVLLGSLGNVGTMQSRPAVIQDNVRGMYRGVKTAERFDVSPPLRTLKGYPAKEEPDRDKFEEIKKTGFEGPPGPQGADEVVQSVTNPFAPMAMPTPIISFDAILGCTGCAPPDPVGDVGPNHYVAMSNSQFRIFNKSGTSVFGPVNINTLWAGFGGPCQTENAGDPVVLYDQLDDRWILTQFTAAGPNYYNCVAISTTANPTGTYFRYAFSTGTNFPDYPKYGMWGDALYISTREFAGGPFAGVGAYAVNRAQLVAGNPAAQVISFLATPASAGGMFNVGDGLLPSDLDGSALPPANSPNYFVGSMDAGASYGAPQDALSFWKFTANFVTPASSTFTLTHTLPVAAIDTIPAFCSGRSCVPQPGTTFKIDHLGYRQRPLNRLAYRNFGTHQSLVTNQSVEASTTMSGIRWYELRVDGAGTPSIFQQGTYAPGTTDNIHRWMGSVAMDASGNMALGYSASAATVTFPSLRYTGRLAGDAPGTMPQGEAIIHTGTGSQTGGGNRWGDYSSMNIDSTDDCTFWYVNEYLPTTSAASWRLRVGSFKFPSCVSGSTPTPTATNTSTSTPSATSTSTSTPTATETFTPTNSPSETPTNTPTPPPVISGTVTYGNAIGSPNPPRFVPGVLIDAVGSPSVSDTTTAAGAYLLTGFGAGSYTITPSKTGGQNGSITSFDAARIAQFVIGGPALSTAQQIVADVSSAGGITSFDAALIARYAAALGPPTGTTGNWIFIPPSNFHESVTSDITGEDYSALLMGETSGNWAEPGGRSANGPEKNITIDLPHLVTAAGNEVLIPVTIQGAANKGIISYEFDLRYDPLVMLPNVQPVDLARTVSRGLMAVVNTDQPGLLRVVMYGPMPLDENGILLNLKFTAIGEPGMATPLILERLIFNEGETAGAVTDGRVELLAAAESQ